MGFSMVMAIKATTHMPGEAFDNLERFIRIGLRSYRLFLDRSELVDFFVITPGRELKNVSTRLTAAAPEFPWVFLDEDRILSSKLSSGWQRQQTSKLAIAHMVKTPYYLIVDDDTFLVRRFCFNDFFSGSDDRRLILNTAEIDFPMWLLWSCQAGDIDVDVVQQEEEIMAITPEIFVTDEVRKLVGRLQKKYDGPGSEKNGWQIALGQNKFTEYTLYWSYLVSEGQAHKLYDIKCRQKLYGAATTGPEHDMEQNMAQAFSPSANFFFSFVQSSLQIPFEKVERSIDRYLHTP